MLALFTACCKEIASYKLEKKQDEPKSLALLDINKEYTVLALFTKSHTDEEISEMLNLRSSSPGNSGLTFSMAVDLIFNHFVFPTLSEKESIEKFMESFETRSIDEKYEFLSSANNENKALFDALISSFRLFILANFLHKTSELTKIIHLISNNLSESFFKVKTLAPFVEFLLKNGLTISSNPTYSFDDDDYIPKQSLIVPQLPFICPSNLQRFDLRVLIVGSSLKFAPTSDHKQIKVIVTLHSLDGTTDVKEFSPRAVSLLVWNEAVTFKSVSLESFLTFSVVDHESNYDFGGFIFPLMLMEQFGPIHEGRYPLNLKIGSNATEALVSDLHVIVNVTGKNQITQLNSKRTQSLRPLVRYGKGQLTCKVVNETRGSHFSSTYYYELQIDGQTQRGYLNDNCYLEISDSLKFSLSVFDIKKKNKALFSTFVSFSPHPFDDNVVQTVQFEKEFSVTLLLRYISAYHIPNCQIIHSPLFLSNIPLNIVFPIQEQRSFAPYYSLICPKPVVSENSLKMHNVENCSYSLLKHSPKLKQSDRRFPFSDVELTAAEKKSHSRALLSQDELISIFSHDISKRPFVLLCGETDAKSPFLLLVSSLRSLLITTNKNILLDIFGTYIPNTLLNAKFQYLLNPSAEIIKEISNFETLQMKQKYKFGVLFAAKKQTDELEFFNNDLSLMTAPLFEDFLNLIGTRVPLKGFPCFRGGLDVVNDFTGKHSVYTIFHNIEIMFHVAPLLPFRENDPQQVEKKRHIGNDVVVVIFKQQEDENDVINLDTFLTQFNHVFIIVVPIVKDGLALYRVQVYSRSGVQPSAPFLNKTGVYKRDKSFREFLLSKCINSERNCLRSANFEVSLTNTRKQFIQSIIKRAEAENKV